MTRLTGPFGHVRVELRDPLVEVPAASLESCPQLRAVRLEPGLLHQGLDRLAELASRRLGGGRQLCFLGQPIEELSLADGYAI